MKEAKGTVLITGASGGLGRSLSRAFAIAGFDLILHGKRKDELELLQKEFEKSSHCEVVIGDLRNTEGIAAVEAALRDPEVNILVNNAAINPELTSNAPVDPQLA